MHCINYVQEFTYLYFDKCQMNVHIFDAERMILINIDYVRTFDYVSTI